MKILIKYAVKLYFYNVILSMIFCNMKYLFYNCQLLLLCCACCKFAMQVFVQEDRHAIQPALAKKLQVLPTDIYPSVFHRELKNNYGILSQLPTDIYLSVFHRELKKKYGILPQLSTGVRDGWHTNRSARLSE